MSPNMMLEPLQLTEPQPQRFMAPPVDPLNMLQAAMADTTGRDLDVANILDPYIRENIFPGVVHLFKDEPRLLTINGPIFKKIARSLTSHNTVSQNPYMQGTSEVQWQLYLQDLFNYMVGEKLLARLFNSKRSNMYGAMKYKFQSKNFLIRLNHTGTFGH